MYFNSSTNDLRESVTIEATDALASESSEILDNAIFTVSREGTDGDLTIFYATNEDQTAESGFDYQALSGSVLIQDGSDSAIIEILPIDDVEAEGAESVILSLVEDDTYGYKVDGSGSASVAIIDDDLTSYVATGENIISGAFVDNNYLATHEQGDGIVETLREQQSGGKRSNRTSYLEHVWTFDGVTGALSFTLVAMRSDNNEGDDFDFEYSSDGSEWNSLVTVNSSAFTEYNYGFVQPVDGVVYVRAIDSDPLTQGNSGRDALSVDYMALNTASIPASATDVVSPAPLAFSDQVGDDIFI